MKLKSWQKNPLTGLQDKFWIFLDILSELGGTYIPLWSEPSTKRTGRRDPDIKPRQYELDDHKYGMDPKTGTIWRRA
jgi:hypothetical protein